MTSKEEPVTGKKPQEPVDSAGLPPPPASPEGRQASPLKGEEINRGPQGDQVTAHIQEASPESLEDLKAKAEDYRNQILRLQAEFANYRKRTEKEKADAIRFGREVTLERMISLNDVMEQALKHSRNASDLDSLKKGFEMVVQEFARLLKSEGVEPLETVGETFDPHLHEAVEQVPTQKEEENNLILAEVQKGYALGGRLLRSAKVKVAKFKKEEKT